MIGSGAMGVVYRATDRELERPTAIKFILPHGDLPEENLITRFYQEARAIAKLDHENIIRIFDLGTWNAIPFIIVEYLKGQSLFSLLRRETAAGQDPTDRR
jgi:serine/threonine protein kinase